jgi:hypothetical protein
LIISKTIWPANFSGIGFVMFPTKIPHYSWSCKKSCQTLAVLVSDWLNLGQSSPFSLKLQVHIHMIWLNLGQSPFNLKLQVHIHMIWLNLGQSSPFSLKLQVHIHMIWLNLGQSSPFSLKLQVHIHMICSLIKIMYSRSSTKLVVHISFNSIIFSPRLMIFGIGVLYRCINTMCHVPSWL